MASSVTSSPITSLVDPIQATRPKTSSSLLFKLANGAIAGITGTLIIFPIDMVKTRLQNQKIGLDGKLPYSSGIDCFRKLVSREGIAGLYRGLIPNLVGVTPEKAIKLAVNDLAREKLARKYNVSPDQLPLAPSVLAGATAGFCQVIATNPMEIVKIRMQVAGSTLLPNQSRPTALAIVKDLGLKGLYKGTPATLLRDVPFSILFFPSHAILKQKMAGPDGITSFSGIFGSGIIAGAIAAAAVTPSDVIKTRLQVASKAGDQVYTGYWNCLRSILSQEGPSALFRGAGARALIVAPLFGIALATYEIMQNFINPKFKPQ